MRGGVSSFILLTLHEDWVVGLIIMSILVVFIVILSSSSSLIIWCFILFWIVLLFFIANSWFLLFLTIELRILPLLFIVLGWGVQVDRLSAGLYILLYVLFFSLPFYLFLTTLEISVLTFGFDVVLF